MVSEYIPGDAEKDNYGEVIAMSGLLPDNSENLSAQVLRGGGTVRPSPEIAVDTVVGRRVSGQKPLFPLQIHTFPHCFQAHALLMSGSQQTVTRILKNS
ncbi:hypothetical protein [uncultured Arthrobacter sp.]|uniref:hypothetical protein n=1 Tax=uncultured Arthrobacter sp. TaxID=114050 RepID=UPI003216A9B4